MLDVDKIVLLLKGEYGNQKPFVGRTHRSPFLVLVSTLLSLRTKDAVTAAAAERLFRLARTPEAMLRLSQSQIQEAIYPVGFYRRKAATILSISRVLVERFGGSVPDSMEGLLQLKGVGRKTANLVLSEAFGKQGLCVDTHVHRISNRLGMVKTKTPFQTEMALRKTLPNKHWRVWNSLLVLHGQRVCTPLSPKCSSCVLSNHCQRNGVSRSR